MAESNKQRQRVKFLRERDGDICWLCKQKIDFTIPDINDSMHYSVDHVVPKANGGPNTRDNMRLAHRACNTLRDCGPLHGTAVSVAFWAAWQLQLDTSPAA